MLALQLVQELVLLAPESVECILDHTDHLRTTYIHQLPYIHTALKGPYRMTRFEVSFQYNIQLPWSVLVAVSPLVVPSTGTHLDHQSQSMNILPRIHIPLRFQNHYRMRKCAVNIQYSIPLHIQVLEWLVLVLVVRRWNNHQFPPNHNLVLLYTTIHLPSCSRIHHMDYLHNSILELEQE
jgi:hypothetical protein